MMLPSFRVRVEEFCCWGFCKNTQCQKVSVTGGLEEWVRSGRNMIMKSFTDIKRSPVYSWTVARGRWSGVLQVP